MKKQVIQKLTALLLAGFCLTGCVDQSGPATEATTESQAQNSYRIVSTSVATCEILDALEIDDVVGVPETDSYTIPERYAEATSIGSPMSPDMEIVSSLNPTIILSPKSLENDLKESYDNINVDSYFLNLESLDGMYQSIEDLGEMFGKEDKAKELCDQYQDYLAELESKHQGEEAPSVLILMGLPGGSYVVATESSYVGSLVKLAGGVNVYGDGDGTDFLNVNPEDMVQTNPDIILRTAHAMPEQVYAAFEEKFATEEIWQSFTAVTENKVYNLDNESCGMSANFHYQDALEDLDQILYGQE